jgi:hypothetical protein
MPTGFSIVGFSATGPPRCGNTRLAAIEFPVREGDRFAMPQIIYTMKNLRKTTPQGKEILKNIWLSFYHGAKIGVLGHNGAGSRRSSGSWPGRTRTSTARPSSPTDTPPVS